MFGELRVVESVFRAFADLVASTTPVSMALSGGATARSCYELLATTEVDWSKTDFFFGDERWVPVHDPESNEGMARETFLDAAVPKAIHSMYQTSSLDPVDAIKAGAKSYASLLATTGPIEMIHLGLGPDGHTASLFPGSAALNETVQLVVPNQDQQHPHLRLTMTYPAIETAHLVVFTVAGKQKHDALARIRSGEDLPASRIRANKVLWLADQDAIEG